MTLRRELVLLFPMVLMGGCDPGNSHVFGKVNGVSIDVTHALYVPETDTGVVDIIISTDPNACTNHLEHSGQFVGLIFGGTRTDPAKPGRYSAVAGGASRPVTAGVLGLSGSCPAPLAVVATDGFVELDTVGDGTDKPANGSLQLSFGSDTLSGTFSARLCGFDPQNVPVSACN